MPKVAAVLARYLYFTFIQYFINPFDKYSFGNYMAVFEALSNSTELISFLKEVLREDIHIFFW